MEEEKRVLDEVEKTLRALDDLPNLQASPFLYTRIRAAIATAGARASHSLVVRMKLKPIGLVILIVFNLFSAIYFMVSSKTDYSRAALISSLNREYNSTQDDSLSGN
jgi:hypothetical protein